MVTTAGQTTASSFDALPVLDLAAPDILGEGNHRLAALRATGPLCWVQPFGALGLLRWTDCDRALRDPRTFSSAFDRSRPVPGAEAETTFDTLLWQDPPEHTRVRRLVQQAFTPERVEAMEPHTRDVARSLLDKIMARGNECEFHRDFAMPLPSYVMSGLLGVDTAMMDTFNHWAYSTFHGPRLAWEVKDPSERDKRLAEIARDAHDMEAYLRERVQYARTSPKPNLITYVVRAQEGTEGLAEREVLTLLKLFVIAGNDITTAALGLTAYCLATHPDQMQLLAHDLSLAANTFEETLRFLGPVMTVQRMTTRDIEIAGMPVPTGTRIAPLVASANHDEAVFEHPDVYDIRRKIPRILSFGSGVHQCLGQTLGRLEGRIALEEWFARVSAFTLKDEPRVSPAIGLRGFTKLPIGYDRRSTSTRVKRPAQSGVNVVAVADKIAQKSDAELGLDKRALTTVKVAWVRDVSPIVKLYKLIHPSGGLLERFTPGSHIVIHMRDGAKTYRNAYSLLNAGYGDGLCYFIAVQLARDSKGGSIYMHERVSRGCELTISVPANNFPVAVHASKHLLIAGGIGVTPMVAFRYALKLKEEQYELHYTYRSGETAAFVDDLVFENDSRDVLYDSSLGHQLDLPSLLRRQPDGTHMYVCGPEGLMVQAIEEAERLGWPPETIHFERFGAPLAKGDTPFRVIAQRSGKTIEVGPSQTALDCLEGAGIHLQSSCRAGSCGSCETRIITGAPVYRNSVMTPAEREAAQVLMPCIDRARGPITLDV
jgi:cytochrome P450/ferredoxin-NADP reductase